MGETKRDRRHPEDQATRIICEAGASTLESVNRQPDFDAMVDRLGQAMGLLSQLAYGILDLQKPGDGDFRRIFERAFDTGRETAKGIVGMVQDT